MSSLNRFSSTKALNSITNADSTTFDDASEPFTLLEWLERSNNTGNADSKVNEYNDYLKAWRVASNQTDSKNSASIRQVYVRFLRELTLNYTSGEERRFLKNVNLDSDVEIDAALSFYASRIKEIIESVYKNRHQLKFQKLKHSWKGTARGVERSIYDALIKRAMYVKKTNLSNTINHTKIIFKELYDTDQNYHNTTYLYTDGGEFLLPDGTIYKGYYHVHYHEDGRKLYMTGKIHTTTPHDVLVKLNYRATYASISLNNQITASSNSNY